MVRLFGACKDLVEAFGMDWDHYPRGSYKRWKFHPSYEQCMTYVQNRWIIGVEVSSYVCNLGMWNRRWWKLEDGWIEDMWVLQSTFEVVWSEK